MRASPRAMINKMAALIIDLCRDDSFSICFLKLEIFSIGPAHNPRMPGVSQPLTTDPLSNGSVERKSMANRRGDLRAGAATSPASTGNRSAFGEKPGGEFAEAVYRTVRMD